MFTSSWSAYKGSGRVGISRGMPRGAPAGFRRYSPLQPGPWLWSPEAEDQDTYRGLYLSQLDKLDPSRVLADLYRLAGDAAPVLLCFCDLRRPGAWCHRTMVAEWITAKTGVAVVEMTPTEVRATRKREQLALF